MKQKNMGDLAVKINSKTEVIISPASEVELQEKPLFAINWFNLKRPWLYNIYAKAAFPHVVKAGGKVLFKAVVEESLSSASKLDRKNLLIVGYPSPGAFLSMLTSKMFLLKSILRLKSVEDFIFGFTARKDNGDEPRTRVTPFKGKNKYMVHLFTSENKTEISQLLPPAGSVQNLRVFYFGTTVARIGRRDVKGKITSGPFPIDGIIVWEAGEVSEFRQLLTTQPYQEFQKSNNTNGIYLVRRIL